MAHVGQYLAQLRRRGWIEPGVATPFAAATLIGILFSDAMGRVVMGDVYSLAPGAAARQYVRFFLRGLGYCGPTSGAGRGRRSAAAATRRSSPARMASRAAAPVTSRSRKRS